MKRGLKLIDPLSYQDRLKNVPKMIVTSSDDEFMMMEWSQIWYDKFEGEKHLMITPNAEHFLFTNVPGAMSAAATFIKSI
jgi:PhoPQ-activated pathogenicity-related protein